MRTPLMLAVVAGLALWATPSSNARAVDSSRARLAALVQTRLASQQVVHLSADEVTLTGDNLRLVGKARVRFDDTFILADEVVINQETKKVELIGNVNAHLPGPPPERVAPRIQYR